ncbi:hypothetical protein [Burkholderia cenocepacia]|uniref:hypothetical protein n=1 Tax=Burkholderia cenocepacia TaxID=95486 RepID=UPI0026543343|nr:hypothetical protein [Burkholderia cenocepacia]MDN7542334.1 hypothetical protein [Burkholderia cenocepacia]
MLHALQSVLNTDLFIVVLAFVAGHAILTFAKAGLSSRFGRTNPVTVGCAVLAVLILQQGWVDLDVVPRLLDPQEVIVLGRMVTLVSTFVISTGYFVGISWLVLKGLMNALKNAETGSTADRAQP